MKKNVVLVLAAVAVVLVEILTPRHTQAAIFTAAVAILSLAFAFRYARFSPWRNNVGGRALMYFSVALGIASAQLFTVWVWGDYPLRAELRALVFGVLIIVLIHLNQIVRSAQRRQNAPELREQERQS